MCCSDSTSIVGNIYRSNNSCIKGRGFSFNISVSESTDYVVESNIFSQEFENLVDMTVDDYGLQAFAITPSYDFVTDGSLICRGDFPSRFSILSKFKLSSGAYGLTFLNLTGPEGLELAVTMDLCLDSINITFNSRCPLRHLQLPFDRSLLQPLDGWHRFSVVVAPQAILLYIDCFLQQVVDVKLTGCVVKCNENCSVGVFQPAASSCGVPKLVIHDTRPVPIAVSL